MPGSTHESESYNCPIGAKTLLVLGNDKISNSALDQLKLNEETKVVIDRSTNIRRVLKLLKKNSLSPVLLCKMVLCEIFRSGKTPSGKYASIYNNQDLINEVKKSSPQRIILFRAGLIINKSVISLGVPLLNVHCAKIPEFGGIGSIAKALKNKAYEQEATLHNVTEKIDEGKVIGTERFSLNPNASYCENETISYNAGMLLLKRIVES